MIDDINPTSIMSLKRECLKRANGDIEQADKLYDYFIKDLQGLPMVDAPALSTMDKVKGVIGDGMGFIKENQDGIIQIISIIKGVLNKNGSSPLPPVGEPLDPINPTE